MWRFSLWMAITMHPALLPFFRTSEGWLSLDRDVAADLVELDDIEVHRLVDEGVEIRHLAQIDLRTGLEGFADAVPHAQVGRGALDGRDRAGLAAGVMSAIPGADRVCEKAQHRAQMIGVEGEGVADGLWGGCESISRCDEKKRRTPRG
jgi:hypothetical protein